MCLPLTIATDWTHSAWFYGPTHLSNSRGCWRPAFTGKRTFRPSTSTALPSSAAGYQVHESRTGTMRRGSLANRRGPPFPAAPMPCSRASGTSAVLRSGVPYSNRAAGDRARTTAATTSTRRPRHDRLRHHSTSGSICRIGNMRTIRARRIALARPEPGSRGVRLWRSRIAGSSTCRR